MTKTIYILTIALALSTVGVRADTQQEEPPKNSSLAKTPHSTKEINERLENLEKLIHKHFDKYVEEEGIEFDFSVFQTEHAEIQSKKGLSKEESDKLFNASKAALKETAVKALRKHLVCHVSQLFEGRCPSTGLRVGKALNLTEEPKLTPLQRYFQNEHQQELDETLLLIGSWHEPSRSLHTESIDFSLTEGDVDADVYIKNSDKLVARLVEAIFGHRHVIIVNEDLLRDPNTLPLLVTLASEFRKHLDIQERPEWFQTSFQKEEINTLRESKGKTLFEQIEKDIAIVRLSNDYSDFIAGIVDKLSQDSHYKGNKVSKHRMERTVKKLYSSFYYGSYKGDYSHHHSTVGMRSEREAFRFMKKDLKLSKEDAITLYLDLYNGAYREKPYELNQEGKLATLWGGPAPLWLKEYAEELFEQVEK